VTGVAGAHFDSIPCIFLAGQVATFRRSSGLGIRQYGFQEVDISTIFSSISKGVYRIDSAQIARRATAESYSLAKAGRPGPVILEIPDDVQRVLFDDEHELDQPTLFQSITSGDLEIKANKISQLLVESLRPVIICGSGLGNLDTESQEYYLSFLDRLSLPVALTWGAKSLVPQSRDYLLGTFGTHGNRDANLAIQKSDLLLILGSRLDTKATGSPATTFAPHARKVMIDIDTYEYRKFEKFQISIEDFVELDFRDFKSRVLFNNIQAPKSTDKTRVEWKQQALTQRIENRIFEEGLDFVDPYKFFQSLSEEASEKTRVIVDTGCAIAWTMQEWKVKKGQKLLHDFNNSAMGWAIPASLASVLIEDDYTTFCVIGDGSLMMGLSDLSTLKKHARSLVIFLLNNGGHSMIKQTQEQWFGGEYIASNAVDDLSFPNFESLARSHGFNYHLLNKNNMRMSSASLGELSQKISFVEVLVNPKARVVPQNRFGSPIDVMEPPLD
jgi:acetolactate synthase-1/2/3 large subunit